MRTVPTFGGNFTLKSVKNEPWNAKTRKKARKGGSFSRFFSFLFLFFFADKRKSLIFATKSRNLLCPSTNAKTDHMKLSVIVPVYNVEKFLPRCLDSLLRQGMEVGEYEIICVNDGSPDGCGKILADYERKHPDLINVITQKNGGLSAARNTGMLRARGEYLVFIDSDDYVVDGAFRYLYDHFCQPAPVPSGQNLGGVTLSEKPDVLNFGFRMVFTDGTTLDDPDAKPDGEILFDGDGVEAYNKNMDPRVWNKFYRHQFLLEHHLKFEIVVFEDNLFNFDVFRLHPRLLIVSCNVNRYEQCNGGSIMRTVNKERVLVQLNDLYYHMSLMYHYLESEEAPDLAPAGWLNLRNCHNTFRNKLCRISLTYDEWSRYTRLLRPRGIALLERQKEPTLPGRVISWLKNRSLRSYPIYRLTYWLYTYVFEGRVRKMIVGH